MTTTFGPIDDVPRNVMRTGDEAVLPDGTMARVVLLSQQALDNDGGCAMCVWFADPETRKTPPYARHNCCVISAQDKQAYDRGVLVRVDAIPKLYMRGELE